MTRDYTRAAALDRADAVPIGAAEIKRFAEAGYVLLPGFLSDDLVARLRPEVDRWIDEGWRARSIASATDPDTQGVPPLLELEQPAHGELVTYPLLMTLLARLMGSAFVFHHLHSDRHAPGVPGKAWHHDYEQHPQSDRRYMMVHALHYLDGLNEKTASLVVLPGSHREVAEKDARAHFGTRELRGEIVIDRLPRGSTVLAHSALFHARRPRPDGRGQSRYFVDASYCQVGARWPPVKPYWRYILRRAEELGLNRDGPPELFAERHFNEYVKVA